MTEPPEPAGAVAEPLFMVNPGDSRKWVIAARALRDRIVSGKLKPGDQLPQRAPLAAELGVSTGTLARAILELADCGVLWRSSQGASRGCPTPPLESPTPHGARGIEDKAWVRIAPPTTSAAIVPASHRKHHTHRQRKVIPASTPASATSLGLRTIPNATLVPEMSKNQVTP